MAELATIARPYAEALFQVACKHDLNAWRAQLDALAAVAGDEGLRQFADIGLGDLRQAGMTVAVAGAAIDGPIAAGRQSAGRGDGKGECEKGQG